MRDTKRIFRKVEQKSKTIENLDINEYLIGTVTFDSCGKLYDYLCDESFEVGEIALTDINKKVVIQSIGYKKTNELGFLIKDIKK